MRTAAEICESVKRSIVPSPRMRRAVENKAEGVRRSVERECQRAKLVAEVRLDGSVAKDTWIRGYVDADVFMRVSPELTKTQLHEICLPIARSALKRYPIVERFAEHPYVESSVEFPGGTLRINVVPCYRVERGNWLSATDRTPYHTQYVREHLKAEQHDEVRLLKAFMRGIGAYGADIKTGGFSGMICETLVISHGDFLTVLEDFQGWKEDRFIDVENQYESRATEVRRIFREPLIVIDPVDKGRNLGAAVRPTQLWNCVAASRQFLKRPTRSMFSEPKIHPLSKTEFRKAVETRGSTILCIASGKIEAVVDILWSQLFRTQRALTHLLENNDFQVLRSTAWSDEKSLNILLFELETALLPWSRRHAGPPVSRVAESAGFLSKHLRDRKTLAGPWIRDGRWTVQKRRVVTSARELLVSAISGGGANVGVARLLTRAFRKNFRVLEGLQMLPLFSSNHEFAKFITEYLSGRPRWLA